MNRPTLQKILLDFEPETRNILAALKKIDSLFGYVSQEQVYAIAKYFSLSPAEVFSTLSFYEDLHYQPRSNVEVKLCVNAPCELNKSGLVMREIEKYLGARADKDKTPKLEIKRVSCQGRCQNGPIMIVNNNVYEKVKPETVDDILGPYFSK